MATFRILNSRSGADLGVWQAADATAALDAMAREAGYADYADLQSQVPAQPDDMLVQEIPFLIEGRDEGGHWSTDSVGSLVVQFASREEAEAAIADLTRTLGWDRARLRVVEAGA